MGLKLMSADLHRALEEIFMSLDTQRLNLHHGCHRRLHYYGYYDTKQDWHDLRHDLPRCNLNAQSSVVSFPNDLVLPKAQLSMLLRFEQPGHFFLSPLAMTYALQQLRKTRRPFPTGDRSLSVRELHLRPSLWVSSLELMVLPLRS